MFGHGIGLNTLLDLLWLRVFCVLLHTSGPLSSVVVVPTRRLFILKYISLFYFVWMSSDVPIAARTTIIVDVIPYLTDAHG